MLLTDKSYMLLAEEGVLHDAVRKAAQMAVDEICAIHACGGPANGDDEDAVDRRLCNLCKSIDILEKCVIIKAAVVAGWEATVNKRVDVLRETRPATTVVEQISAGTTLK